MRTKFLLVKFIQEHERICEGDEIVLLEELLLSNVFSHKLPTPREIRPVIPRIAAPPLLQPLKNAPRQVPRKTSVSPPIRTPPMIPFPLSPPLLSIPLSSQPRQQQKTQSTLVSRIKPLSENRNEKQDLHKQEETQFFAWDDEEEKEKITQTTTTTKSPDSSIVPFRFD